MRLGANIAAGFQPLVDLVYPPRCPACGEAIAQQLGLCTDCWDGLSFPEPAYGADPDNDDQQAPIIAATLYNDVSRQIVLNFKHGSKITLAKLMAQMMASKMPSSSAEAPNLLIPVPLHRTRLWKRGYNQAALLAKELAAHSVGDVMVDALVRTKRTQSLGGLGPEQRRTVLEGAIKARRSKADRIAGRDVILVDDVFTSGATSSACVSSLRKNGAKSVKIACFARVADRIRNK